MKINLRNDRRSNIFERKQLIVKTYGGKNILVDELITPIKLRRARLLERTPAIRTNTPNTTCSLNQTWSKIKSTSQPLILRKQLINWDVLKINDNNNQETTLDELRSCGQDLSIIESAANKKFNSTMLDNNSIFDYSVVQVVKCHSLVSDKIITRSFYKKLASSNSSVLLNPPPTNLEIHSKPKPNTNKFDNRIFSPRRLRKRSTQQKTNKDVKSAWVPVTTKQVSTRNRKRTMNKCDATGSTTILPDKKPVKRLNKQTIDINNNEKVLRKTTRLTELANSSVNKTNSAKVVLTPLSLPLKVVKKVPKRKQKPYQKKGKENADQFPTTSSGVNFFTTKGQNLKDKDKKIVIPKDHGNTLSKLKKSYSKDKALKVSKQKAKKLTKKSSGVTSKKNAFENLEEENIILNKIVFPITARKGTLKLKRAFREYLDQESKDDAPDHLATPFRKNFFTLGNLKINDENLNDVDSVCCTPHSICSLPSPVPSIKTPVDRINFSPANFLNKRKMADKFQLNLKRRAKPQIKKAGIKKKRNIQENLDKIINKQKKAIKQHEEAKGFLNDDDQELSENDESYTI